MSFLKYRINCKLTGKWRQFDRYVIKEKLKKKLENENVNSEFNYEIDEIEPNIEVILHITNDCIACGIQLHRNSLALRSYIKHIGLRSTICAVMLQLAEIDKNKYKIYCDPFCGKGTIIIESRNSFDFKSYFLLSDMSNEQINLCRENIEYSKFNSNNIDLLNLCLKSTTSFPYRDHTIDVIITDLPFGKQHSIESFLSNESFNKNSVYLKIINEFKRILIKSEGILVILINRYDMNIFENCIEISNESENIFKKLLIVQKQKLDLVETVATVYKIIN